ncbi:RHE_PE00001 family protein [Oryzifoliimicrobium ureilyticus]|uniref:RHE_PE00001 family protein n=1 Tax=Oryzifoliimicrobium ureilyticus TaxID=3113724 RepID=UPI0030761C77
MGYEIETALLKALLPAIIAAEDALARLDERVSHSPVGKGFSERAHYFDSVSALWVAGELVHVEDLVLHDVHMDSQAPSHELTIAAAILRTRRRLWAAEKNWPFTPGGLSALSGGEDSSAERLPVATSSSYEDNRDDVEDGFSSQLAEIDAVLARSQKLINSHFSPPPGEELVAPSIVKDNDPLGLFANEDWDEAKRLGQWRAAVDAADSLPPVLGAAMLFELWQKIEPLRRQNWLGGLLAEAYLRRSGKVSSHLFAFHVGLKSIRYERRRSRDRLTRLGAYLEAMTETAQTGLKEIDRLTIARTQLETRFRDRRSNSSLPKLAEFVLSRPLVSSGMVAHELGITNRGALNLLKETGIRELTGRGRYRAWGIL